MHRHSFLSLLFGTALLAGCGGKSPSDPNANGNGDAAKPVVPEPKVVLASTTMIADLVRKVGGDRIAAAALMGPGVDPHLYKPTTTDINNLTWSKLTVYNGLALEGRMVELFESMATKGRKMLAVAEAVPPKELIRPRDGHHADPHIWGNVENWIRAIDLVQAKLAELEPAAADAFAANAAATRKEWQDLHAWAKARAAEVPKERRVLITSHDAFAYLGAAYGFEVVGVQGISTTSEAGLADISRTVDFIRERKIPAIFVESSVPPATIERISRDAGAKIGGELFSDACGMPGQMVTRHGETYDLGTYTGMMKHNINTIVDALK
jgi:manganese/zinc/iron transport system substrate-binding protein